MRASILVAVAVGTAGGTAQHNMATANGCNDGYYPGTDTVTYTVPYTYAEVISIIGDFQNLTWSGNPPNTVTLDGPDNTVGTSRTYDTAGAHVVETLTYYSKPVDGPYVEIHSLAPVTVPAANVSFYGDYDGTVVMPTCNGTASTFNFTINYCGTNAAVAGAVLHALHLMDAMTVGKFLGGKNFTTCYAVTYPSSTGTGSSGSSTPTQVTTSAGTLNVASISTIILVVGGLVAWIGL